MFAPVLTRNDSPAPAVQILFSSLDASTVEVTLWRLSPDGQQVVRGAEREYAVGGFVVTDYEVPLGVEVTYRAEQFNASGISIGFTDGTAVQVPSSPETAWVQDPLDPGSAVEVRKGARFTSELSRQRQVKTYFAGGRTTALLGAVSPYVQIPLDLVTLTESEASALSIVLDRGVVLFRTAPPHRIPRLLYVVVPGTQQRIQYEAINPAATWPISGDEVSPTTRAIVVALFTWADIDAAYATWDLVKSNYLTWLDVKANPPEGS